MAGFYSLSPAVVQGLVRTAMRQGVLLFIQPSFVEVNHAPGCIAEQQEEPFLCNCPVEIVVVYKSKVVRHE